MQDVRSANNMNDATQPQHFTLRSGSSTSGSPASSRASSQSGFRVQAQSNHTPRPFSWGLNPVALPQSQPSSRASSSSGQTRRSCLHPALTSWRETLRLLKKNKNPPPRGEFFLHGFALNKCYSSRPYINIRPVRIARFARFCATKLYSSRPYIYVRTGGIAFSFAVRVKMRVYKQAWR